MALLVSSCRNPRSPRGAGFILRRASARFSADANFCAFTLNPLSKLALAILLFVCPAAAADLEYSVKAAFLINFTKFVQWPQSAFENARSPLNICILGDDPFGTALEQAVEGETVSGRSLSVRRVRRVPEPKSCQVLFLSASEKDVKRTIGALGPGVLTVGEGAGFLADRGMIAFVLDNRRVRFDVGLAAVTSGGLAISSRMLTVARTVHK
jgi:hypothetical protein